MKTPNLLRTSAFRLSIRYAAIFGVSAAVLLAIIYAVTVRLLVNEIDAAIEAESIGIHEVYEARGVDALVRAVAERSEPGGEPGSVYLLLDRHSRALAGNLASWPARTVADGRFFQFEIDDPAPGGKTPHAVRARTFTLRGRYRLLVGRDIAALTRFKGLMARSLGWGLAATMALSLLGGFIMSRIVLRRVNAIALATRSIVRGDLARRMPVGDSGDELDLLATSLNEMLEQIEALMSALRTMADSIAHDLRGPLTRLKTRVELSLLGGKEIESYKKALHEALAEADGILATFNLLLEIAQAEAGPAGTEMHEIELGDLARDVVDLYEPLADEHGLKLEATIEQACILGNHQLLSQAVGNLLDNAIKYTPRGGVVGLSVSARTGGAELAVRDTGPGIPAADRGRVLDRFVRLDTSRSTPGHGLGLSLVASVARLHRAKLTLSDQGPGLCVRLEFPRARDPGSKG